MESTLELKTPYVPEKKYLSLETKIEEITVDRTENPNCADRTEKKIMVI